MKNLHKFYAEGVQALRSEAKKDRNWETNLRAKRDLEITKKEVCTQNAQKKTNLDGPSRAIRQSPTYTSSAVAMYPQFNRTASFTVRRSGMHNVDRYRPLEPTFTQLLRDKDAKLLNQNHTQAKSSIESITKNATEMRQTVVINENGKSTTLVYNSFALEIENSEKYFKLFGYLFPSKMRSYQLVDFNDGKFEYSLNGNIIYNVCVVGITEDGYEYFQKQTLNSGDLGEIKLKPLTERDLEASIRQLNQKRISRPTPILSEPDPVLAESSNYREQKRL